MNSTEKLCRFCLRYVKDTYFDDLREPCDIFSDLNLKVNMDICKEPIICADCIERLRKLFSFKVTCAQSEYCLKPFINSHVDKKIDLQQVYLEMNGSKCLDNKKVCRFCMCETSIDSSLELNAIIEFMLPTMYFLEFFPELDINLVRDPIICKTCHNFLEDHVTFTRKCMNVEENIQKYIEQEGVDAEGKIDLKGAKQFMDKIIIKREIEDGDTFKHEIQNYDIVEEASSKLDLKMESEIHTEDCQLEIKSESIEEKPIVNSSESILEPVSAQSRENYTEDFVIGKSIKCHSCEVTMYKCEIETCSFETKHKDYLTRHKLIHKDVSKIMTYKCEFEECLYQTKFKNHLMRHKLVHKHPSEVTIYKCEFEGCSHETKHKSNLIQHKLIHKDVTELVMYKCGFEGCLYETKYNRNLTKHKLIHKKLIHNDPSKVMMYKCGIEYCPYETKHKINLVKHKLIHKDVSDVIMYKCEFGECPYESKHKSNLIKHKLIHKKLIHKDPSKVTMYKCGTEDCLYETEHKSNFIKHKLIHKDIAEVMMYKCGFQGCLHETKYKSSLIDHMLIHKDPSEVTVYKCQAEGCSYRTIHKSELIRHKFMYNWR